MSKDRQISLDLMIKRIQLVIKDKLLPQHDVFSISEVLGAATGLPKEYILDEMLAAPKETAEPK